MEQLENNFVFIFLYIDKKVKLMFLSNRKYDINDITNIVTPNAKFKSIYMGLEGGDVRDILDKLNPQFEKSDPFDGVFILFTENLPEKFIQKGIRFFLFNENLVGNGNQIVKTYNNDGKFIHKYKVKINSVDLDEKQDIPYKINLSGIPIGPSILETIKIEKFQKILNTPTIRFLKFEQFNTDIDFLKIK